MALRKHQHNYAGARRLRRALSLPEGLLWRELKGRSQGVKLRKQHPIGPFAEQGIELIRIPAKEVLTDPGEVAAAIIALCFNRSR